MTDTQKIILIALLAAGLICLVVGFSLMHYIGGFMRHVEDEAREEAEAGKATEILPDDAPESKEKS